MHFDPNIPAVDQVSMAFDRRIPPHLLNAARAIDAARARTTVHLKPRSVRFKSEAIIKVMAHAIIDAWAKRGEVHAMDFQRCGLTSRQVDDFRDAAWSRALAMEPRVVALMDARG